MKIPGAQLRPVIADPLRTGTVLAPANRRGSAVLVILALLAAMSAIVIANTHALHALKQELLLLDQRHKQRLNAGPG